MLIVLILPRYDLFFHKKTSRSWFYYRALLISVLHSAFATQLKCLVRRYLVVWFQLNGL